MRAENTQATARGSAWSFSGDCSFQLSIKTPSSSDTIEPHQRGVLMKEMCHI